MFLHLHLHLNERAVLVRDGHPVKALGPGRYTFWKRYEVVRWNTDELTFTAPAAVLAALPNDWFETINIARGQYGIVFRDERAAVFMKPGVHRVWKVEANVVPRVYAEGEPLPVLTDELRAVIPAGELLEANLELNQRAVLLRDGVPERRLAPGPHAFWGKHNKLVLWNIDEVVFAAAPDVLKLLPEAWWEPVTLATDERAIVLRDDKPVKFLRPGVHRMWTVNPNVTVETYKVTGEAPELTDELRAVIPATEIVEAQVRQFERGLKYVQGRFEGILEPGRYTFWNHPAARVAVQVSTPACSS